MGSPNHLDLANCSSSGAEKYVDTYICSLYLWLFFVLGKLLAPVLLCVRACNICRQGTRSPSTCCSVRHYEVFAE